MTPPKPNPPRPSASSARIDADDSTVGWELSSNYTGADETIATWTLKARDQAALDRAKKAVEDAVSSLIARKRRHKGSTESHALSTSKESVIAFMQRDDRWRYLHGWQVEQTLDLLVDQDILCERSNGRYSLRRTSC